MKIRIAAESDAPALVEIYRYYVEKTAITFECHTPSVEEFKVRIRHTLERYPFLLAVDEGKIVGYAYASPFKTREAYDWSVETSIYVDHRFTGNGIGNELYHALEEILKLQHITRLYACIAYPETPDKYLTDNSAEYHAHLGYRLVGKFDSCAYKFDSWYHMIWMEKKLSECSDQPEPVIWFPEIRDSLDFHA